MYATDRRQTKASFNASALWRRIHNNRRKSYKLKRSRLLTFPCRGNRLLMKCRRSLCYSSSNFTAVLLHVRICSCVVVVLPLLTYCRLSPLFLPSCVCEFWKSFGGAGDVTSNSRLDFDPGHDADKGIFKRNFFPSREGDLFIIYFDFMLLRLNYFV